MPIKHSTSENIRERLDKLERLANTNFFELDKKISEYDKLEERIKINFFEIEKRLIELEKTIEAGGALAIAAPAAPPEKLIEKKVSEYTERFEERIKQLEDLLILLEVEVVKSKSKAMEVVEQDMVPNIPSDVADKIAVLEEKIQAIEKLKLKIPAERIKVEPRLQALEDELHSIDNRLRDETEKLKEMISGKTLTQESMGYFERRLREEMDEIRRDLSRADVLKDEALAIQKDLARRSDFEKFEARVKDDIRKIGSTVDRIGALEKSLDTRLVDIEEKLTEMVKDNIKKIDADLKNEILRMDQISKNMESKAISIEGKLTEMVKDETRKIGEAARREIILTAATKKDMETIEQQIDAMRKHLDAQIAAFEEKAQPELFRKVEEISRNMNNLERDLEIKSTRVLTKELSNFANELEKRFPDLARRDEMNAWARNFERKTMIRLDEMQNRIRTIETPDLYQIISRVDELEMRISDLMALIRDIARRMPLVVE